MKKLAKKLLKKILSQKQIELCKRAQNTIYSVINKISKRFKIIFLPKILIRLNYSPHSEKLIIILTLGSDNVVGGILSISSIYEETAKVKNIHGAEVIMCTVPGEPLLLRYTKFKNRNYIYGFSQVLSYFPNLKSLVIHIPEVMVHKFLKNISNRDYEKLGKIKSLHLNIMLQNIELLEPMVYVEQLKKLGTVTCTTVHKRYTTLELRERLGVPVHRLSVFVSPEQYERKRYSEKEDLIIVSPDKHERKSEVLDLLAGQFPKMKIQIIMGITYDEYKAVISKAKWAITFGEGLDNYFVEPVFSGGVSFSVYNDRFFTEEFKTLRTLYKDYDVLLKNICSDMMSLDDELQYRVYQNELFNLCAKHYNYNEYINNLKLFYRGEYTYK